MKKFTAVATLALGLAAAGMAAEFKGFVEDTNCSSKAGMKDLSLIHILVESSGRFEVEQFRIGRTNSEPSYLRLRLETPTRNQMEHLLAQILPIGCSPIESGDAVLKLVERDRCAPEDFYSTSNHRTYVRVGGEWVEVQNQRMDALSLIHI